MARLVVAALLASAVGAIYPSDQWEFSTKLTTDTFEPFVKENVDQGRTVFAPAWNAITREFHNNNDVVFGDVNLRDDPIRGNYSPGAGGWPTIRYFNKDTGYDGKPYPKKTSKSMCDELGNTDYMRAYVEEMGQTSRCQLDGNGCGEKELGFIEKWKDKAVDEVNAQLERLQGMADTKAKPELVQWIKQRISILKQLASSGGQKDEL